MEFRHNRKLAKLGIDLDKKVNKNKVIYNLSDRTLTEEQKDILSLGLDYCMPLSSIKHTKFFLHFEKLCHTIKNSPIYKDTWKNVTNSISTKANETFRLFKRQKTDNHEPNPFIPPLKALKDDDNIIITKPDKGRGVVILNRDDYENKLQTILNDNTKFRQITTDTATYLMKMEDKLNRVLRPIKTAIGEATYNFITASGSKPGSLYGLPKIHKLLVPIRPIISAIGTFNYNLAKFIVQIITPLTTNQYTIENSISFVNEICDLKISHPVTMASFDIESLFTNVPLNETTDLITSKTTPALLDPYGLTIKIFKKLLNIAAHHSVFTFDDKLYIQVDGLAMGSPLSPCYANAFLSHHEQNWLNDCPFHFKPVFYRRYMDDTFLLFKDPSHVNLFLNYLNSKHPNIKFTCEIEQNNKLSFLDSTIHFHNNQFSTNTYRKPSHTGLGLNFLSHIPRIYKINSIKTLINRAFNICSNWSYFHEEMIFLKDYFTSNGFPAHLFNKILNEFLCNKFAPPKPATTTVKKDIKYIKLPYMGDLSFDLRKSLNKILTQAYPQINFRFVFHNTNTIGNFLKKGRKNAGLMCSNVVYMFTCPCCNARYVGSTTRWLHHRIAEHKGKSTRTGRQLSDPSPSAIRDHSHQHNHQYGTEDFSILHLLPNRYELNITESITIKTMQPELNNTTSATPLFTL